MRPLAKLFDQLRDVRQRRALTSEHARGRRGEDLAHRHLQRLGYEVVARNYRTPAAGHEADIVAWDGEYLAFIEVKTRYSNETATPDRAVTPEKRRRIINAALDYSKRANVEWSFVRFDIVAITEAPRLTIELYRDAFGLTRYSV